MSFAPASEPAHRRHVYAPYCVACHELAPPLAHGVQVIGVEPSGANAMAQSLQIGERVALARVDAFADGVAVKQVRRPARASALCSCCSLVWARITTDAHRCRTVTAASDCAAKCAPAYLNLNRVLLVLSRCGHRLGERGFVRT